MQRADHFVRSNFRRCAILPSARVASLLPSVVVAVTMTRLPMPERFDLVPTNLTLIQFPLQGRVAAQQLWRSVNAVDGDVDVAIIVEIAEGASTRRGILENSGATMVRHFFVNGRCADFDKDTYAPRTSDRLWSCRLPDRHGRSTSADPTSPSLSMSKKPTPHPRSLVLTPSPPG